MKKPVKTDLYKRIKLLTDKLEKRALDELGKEVGESDYQWARGILYAVNSFRKGKMHEE